MRFTIAVAGAFAAVAVAQSSSDSSTQAASQTYSMSPAQSSTIACINACDPGDVKCQSYCIDVPSPNEDQVNQTNECIADCDQGKGTESDIARYTQCRDKCISDHYYVTSEGTPTATGGSGSSNGNAGGAPSSQTSGAAAPSSSGSGDDDNESTATTSGSPTETSGGANESTETPGAAPALAGSALFGLLAAVLAL